MTGLSREDHGWKQEESVRLVSSNLAVIHDTSLFRRLFVTADYIEKKTVFFAQDGLKAPKVVSYFSTVKHTVASEENRSVYFERRRQNIFLQSITETTGSDHRFSDQWQPALINRLILQDN